MSLNDAFIVRRGGGTSLNFKVIGGTTQPTSASENTIWVNTGTEITDWIFSATQPTTRSDGKALSGGEVWFNISTSSPTPINALKKNGLYVYPNACKQYVGGAWEIKPAQTYQGGKWADWRAYFFDNGDLGISGGFTAVNEDGSDASSRMTVGDAISLHRVQYSKYGYYSNNKYNVTNYSILRIAVDLTNTWTSEKCYVKVGLNDSPAYNTYAVSMTINNKDTATFDIDISALSGEQHLVVWHYFSNGGDSSYLNLYSAELIP